MHRLTAHLEIQNTHYETQQHFSDVNSFAHYWQQYNQTLFWILRGAIFFKNVFYGINILSYGTAMYKYCM